MIGALVRKELRDLRPWAVLSVLLGLSDSLMRLGEQVDMLPLSISFHGVQQVAVVWFMGFAIGTGITTREHDDGTLAFLDGLPVSRGTVFAVKCAVVVAMVSLVSIVDTLGAVSYHLLSRGSLDHALRLPLLAMLLATHVLLCCNAVCAGAALGRLRSLTWLVAGVCATGLMLVVEYLPRARLLNPLALAQAKPLGLRLSIDAEGLAVQAGLTIVAALIAWRGFVQAGPSWLSQLSRRPELGTLLKAATAIALLVPLAIWTHQMLESGSDGEDEEPVLDPELGVPVAEVPRFGSSALGRTRTRHYSFSYPAVRADAARQLSAQADALFERVHALLGVELGSSIDVDLSGSLRNTEGTAYFGRIRMALSEDALAVLAHETSHVVCQTLAAVDRSALWQRATVLDEGVATWVERHFGQQHGQAATDDLILAALHARRELVADEFVDAQLLAERRDQSLQYPIGAGLVSAVVRLYGEPALPRLVRAFGDRALPGTLRGHALWQATFQRAGMDLGSVVDDFYRQVGEHLARVRGQVAALPRPRVRLVEEHGEIGVQALLDLPRAVQSGAPDRRLRLRFKPLASSPLEQIDSYEVNEDEPIWRDASDIAGSQVCVQAGVSVGARALYEPWICLPTRDAAPWPP